MILQCLEHIAFIIDYVTDVDPLVLLKHFIFYKSTFCTKTLCSAMKKFNPFPPFVLVCIYLYKKSQLREKNVLLSLLQVVVTPRGVAWDFPGGGGFTNKMKNLSINLNILLSCHTF